MRYHLLIVLFLTFFYLPHGVTASVSPGALFTYEGVLTDTNGVAITTSQTVTLQILYPSSCVLLEETHTINPGNAGEFSVIVGSGLRVDSTNNGAEKIFATSGTVNCMDGSTATVTGTPRALRVKVNSTTLAPDVTITNVPFAINASRLSDKAASDFVQASANITQSRVEDVFTRYTALDAALDIFSTAPSNGQLLGGNGGVYAPINLAAGAGINITHSAGTITIASTGGGGSVAAVTAQPPLSVGGSASNPDITLSQAGVSTHGYLSSTDWNVFNNKLGTSLSSGKILVGSATNVASPVNLSGDATLDNSGILTLANVGTPGTYVKVTTDAKGRVTGGTTLSAADIPTLDWTKITGLPTSLAGYGIADAVSKAGDTMTGTLNMGGNDLLNTGHITMGTQKTLKLGNYSSAQEGTMVTTLNGTHLGYTWYNTSTNEIKYWNGSAVVTLGAAGGGITSLNGLTSPAQTFNFDATGVDVAFSSAGAIHTFHFPSASSTARGLLTSADWINFNNKLSNAVAFSGDVSGTFATISVDKIKGRSISGTTPSAGSILRYSGSEWTPANLNVDINADTTSTLSVSRGGTGTTSFVPNRMIASNAGGSALTDFSCAMGWIPAFDAMGIIGCYTPTNLGLVANGGNSFGGDIFVGTNDSNSLILKTSGQNRIAIDPSGKVGIGTLYPAGTLDLVTQGSGGVLTHRTYSDTAVNSAMFLGMRARGSQGAPTVVQDGDSITDFFGTTDLGYPSRAGMSVKATEFHTNGSSMGLGLEFYTVPNATLTRKKALTISDKGQVGIGALSNAGVSTLPGQAHPSNQNILEVTGTTGVPASYSTGNILLTNNGGTEASGDELGSVMFGHKSATYGLYARIRSFSAGSVTNNRGGNLAFLTKPDGVNSTSERMRITHDGMVGIGTSTPSMLLHVNGSAGGTSAWTNVSDRRLKSDIQLIPDSLHKILSLKGVTYEWRRDVRPDFKFSPGRDMGVIAQDVEAVFPEAISTDDKGFKSVAYTKLIGPLIEAIKEMYVSLTEVKSTVETQSRELASLKEKNLHLEAQNQQKEEEIQQLKSYLCAKDQAAPFCR